MSNQAVTNLTVTLPASTWDDISFALYSLADIEEMLAALPGQTEDRVNLVLSSADAYALHTVLEDAIKEGVRA